MTSQISRRIFFYVWFANSKETRLDALLCFILQELGFPSLSEDIIKSLKVSIRSVCQKIEQKWSKSGRHRERFLNANSEWLKENISLPDIVIDTDEEISLPGTSSRAGRPQKDFSSSSARTKRRRVQHILETSSQEEISMATALNLRKEGKRDSAAIVEELCQFSLRRRTSMKKARKILESPKKVGLTADQALALMVDANLTTHQYNLVRQQAKSVDSKIYPSYYKVKAAKQLCYPEDIHVTETYAEIKLQSLIDHTVKRLCEAQEEVLKTATNFETINIIIKWGCDGAEQNRYKQQFSEDECSDESLFSTSMVPMQMYSENEKGTKTIYWQNPSPSSTRYCRPIKFVFAKETIDLIKSEVNKIQDQVASQAPTKIIVNVMEVVIKPILVLCMIDGKICNALAECASTQTCYLCGAKPSEMNKEKIILEKTLKRDLICLGLSPLHAWIRFFECILHISYRLDIQSWQARGAENKKKVADKKKLVQEKFRKELGLLVDMPKQQTGNTNDGNTARKFFRNPEISAEITGVNVELIRRFHVILECINTGFSINLDKFQGYAKETRELYLKEYPWYSMPVSVHKILFHGKDIIKSCILPIGQLSEEAQEARNKHNRKYRELFTRKTSRIDTNTDLINRLLITSDPLIASKRALPKTKRGKLTPEVCELLEIENQDVSSEDSDYYSLEITFEPKDIVSGNTNSNLINQHLQTLTTKSTFNEDNENFTEMQSKSIEDDVQKFNSGALYPDITPLNGHNQLQQKKDNEQNMEKDTTEYLTASGSNDSKEWVTNHKKLARSSFEKHKAHRRNYRRYGHKSSHNKNHPKLKKYEHIKSRKRFNMQNLFNQQHPYYQGQVSYYGDTDSADESIYLPAKMRSHRYQHHRGHHINRMDEYNQNSKWPHLSRVQYQLYQDEKDDDLPPYIRKYNRRNKQLLDLLEGTMPPPTPPLSQPSGISVVNKKRREKSQHRYHNHKNPKWIMEDLFEEQRANPNNPNMEDDQYVNDSAAPNNSPAMKSEEDELKLIQENELPEDDISTSLEEDDNGQLKDDLQRNMKIREQSSPAATSITNHRNDLKFSPKANKFIYHRVDAPGMVGAGIGGPKKQRLPFVAITDRRLETSKMRSRDFEQNHQPMP